MKKFKVGQKYVVDQTIKGEAGNVIEITEVNKNTMRYKVVSGTEPDSYVLDTFCKKSIFASHLKPVENECIVIYRKGREVIALDKLTGEKATARCHPDDEFNFKFGATLAFDRLTNRAPECKKVKFKLGLGIWCENEKQFDKLMCHLDKIGCRWVCGGERPTEWKPQNPNNGVRIYIKTDKTISFSRREAVLHDIYTAIDFDNVDFSDLKPLYNGKVVCVDNKNNTDTWTIGKIYQFTGGLIVSDAGVVFPGKYTPVYSFKEWSDWTSAKFIEVVE